jgi:hypothetical protein
MRLPNLVNEPALLLEVEPNFFDPGKLEAMIG